MNAFFIGTAHILAYFAVCVTVVFSVRCLVSIPRELFRKILHLVLLGSLVVWLFVYRTWLQAAISALAFALLVYPILVLAERIRGYSDFVTERKRGELKASLLLVFSMFAAVTAIGWGVFGDRYLTLAAIFAWGLGDAAAALVGKRFGRHPLEGRHIEGRKSLEGSAAMLIVSFCSVLLILWLRGGMGFFPCAAIALVVSAVSAVIELYSLRGNDTLFCPLGAMAVMLPLLWLLGGL